MLEEFIINNQKLQNQYRNCIKTDYRFLKSMYSGKNKVKIDENDLIEPNEFNNNNLKIKIPYNPDQNNFTSSNNDENHLYITHVTLKLDVLNSSPFSSHIWRYNSIRKNIFSPNLKKITCNSSIIRSK